MADGEYTGICDTQLQKNDKLSRTQYAYPVLDSPIYLY